MKILPLNESRLDEAVKFVTRINPDCAHNIGYFDETEEEIRAEISAVQPPEGHCFIAVSKDGRLIGLLGAEIDKGLGRCWLYGPLIDHPGWHSIADRLYDAILAILHEEVCDQEIFCGSNNIQVQEFAVRHGFPLHSEGVVLTLENLQVDHISNLDTYTFAEKYTGEFSLLHERLFPNTYYSAQQLIKLAKDSDKQLFVHIRNGKLFGYIFIQVREASRDGYIDFIGVDETVRRQGIGTQLVAYASDWALSHPQIDKITLTVSTDNIPAIYLYQSLGFKAGKVSKGYRKRI
jgi:ribosomal protein S18 acetylase RimI-like enzyme